MGQLTPRAESTYTLPHASPSILTPALPPWTHLTAQPGLTASTTQVPRGYCSESTPAPANKQSSDLCKRQWENSKNDRHGSHPRRSTQARRPSRAFRLRRLLAREHVCRSGPGFRHTGACGNDTRVSASSRPPVRHTDLPIHHRLTGFLEARPQSHVPRTGRKGRHLCPFRRTRRCQLQDLLPERLLVSVLDLGCHSGREEIVGALQAGREASSDWQEGAINPRLSIAKARSHHQSGLLFSSRPISAARIPLNQGRK